MTTDAAPPHDLGAEEAVLGACLLSVEALDAVCSVVTSGDFYRPAHQHIASAVLSLHARGCPVDVVMVADELRRDGLLDQVGGVEALHKLQNAAPSISNAHQHAGIVLDTAERRRVIMLASNLTVAAYKGGEIGPEVGAITAWRGRSATDVDESWLPFDLAEVLAGTVAQPIPELLTRDDGQGLLYLGHLNGAHGDSGVGKGWVALVAVAQELARGHDVMIVDAEDTATSVAARLRLLGVDDEAIAGRVIYVRPTVETNAQVVDHLCRVIVERDVSLVIIDSIGECFGLDAIDENHDAEVGPWLRRVARPLADTGAAVLLVDHGTKAQDNPLHPSGSKRKRAAIGGASYLVTAATPLAAGAGGRLRLTCAKDRHGTWRRGEHVADLVLTPSPAGRLNATLYAADPSDDAELPVNSAARDAVRAAREAGEALSLRALCGLMTVRARKDVLYGGIDLAVARAGLTETSGPRGARMFLYRADLTENQS